MANLIQFETGIREYRLNDAVSVRFNPTDETFIGKVFDALNSMDETEQAFLKTVEATESNAKAFSLIQDRDAEIRETINGIFKEDVCTPLFGDMCLMALGDGLPLWANLILAIIDTLDGEFAAEKKKTNPRLAKYTAKYATKRNK